MIAIVMAIGIVVVVVVVVVMTTHVLEEWCDHPPTQCGHDTTDTSNHGRPSITIECG